MSPWELNDRARNIETFEEMVVRQEADDAAQRKKRTPHNQSKEQTEYDERREQEYQVEMNIKKIKNDQLFEREGTYAKGAAARQIEQIRKYYECKRRSARKSLEFNDREKEQERLAQKEWSKEYGKRINDQKRERSQHLSKMREYAVYARNELKDKVAAASMLQQAERFAAQTEKRVKDAVASEYAKDTKHTAWLVQLKAKIQKEKDEAKKKAAEKKRKESIPPTPKEVISYDEYKRRQKESATETKARQATRFRNHQSFGLN